KPADMVTVRVPTMEISSAWGAPALSGGSLQPAQGQRGVYGVGATGRGWRVAAQPPAPAQPVTHPVGMDEQRPGRRLERAADLQERGDGLEQDVSRLGPRAGDVLE